jgi:tetratricopeptide (TPR) repeat protein
MSTKILRFARTVLLAIVLPCANCGAQETVNSLQTFTTDTQYVRETIEQTDLADSLIASTSVLFFWHEHPAFGDLVSRTLLPSYREHTPGEISAEVDRRLGALAGTTDWLGWFDTGVLALAAGEVVEASRCFAEAVKDDLFADSPYGYAYLGRCCLAQGKSGEADSLYAQALAKSANDPAVAFWVRYRFCQDLCENRQVERTLCGSGPLCESLGSSYPVERAYALYETVMHAWAEGEETAVAASLEELRKLLPSITPRTDSRFEQRRGAEAATLVARIDAALTGDSYGRMILDEEACQYDVWSGSSELVCGRLRHWIESYPIETFSKLEGKEQQSALLTVHFSYNIAACRAGRHADAEMQLRRFIDSVSYEKEPAKVSASYTWLAYALHSQGRFDEALKVCNEGLSVIPEESPYYASLLAHQEETVSSLPQEGGRDR